MSKRSSKSKYTWPSDSSPPNIEAHSVRKNEILKEYLIYYLEILTQRPKPTDFYLTLVDGFSGGGEYFYNGKIISGSPLIMQEAVKEAQVKINLQRQKSNMQPVNINTHYFFVEKEKASCQYLQNSLNKKDCDPKEYTLINGIFEEQCERIIREIREKLGHRNCIFLLDQYGYTDVRLESISSIFRKLPKAEVILTFSVDYLIDFLTDKGDRSSKILKSIGFNEVVIKKILKELGRKENKNWKRNIQYIIYPYIFRESGASYYTPFFVKSEKSSRSYWLLHLSKHPRARDAMMDIHWKNSSSFSHFGRPGLYMLGYDSKLDQNFTGQMDLPEYEFDTEARNKTIKMLSNELPADIYKSNIESISFSDLYGQKCNDTTANKEIFKQSLQASLDNGDIEIISKKGEKRRKSSPIKDNDIIRQPVQKKLFFFLR